MPEIIILSGKGGTGKTTLSAAFASLAKDAVICDLDVDAPDLHLLLKPEVKEHNEFYSGNEAIIDPDKCIACGECVERCRFDAIDEQDGVYRINPFECEGCKVCVHFCPEEAIDFPERHCGSWYVSQTRFGPMVHAQLFPGQENLRPPGVLVAPAGQGVGQLEQTGYDSVRRHPGHRLSGDQFPERHRPGRGRDRAHTLGPPRPGARPGAGHPLPGAGGGDHQ